MSKMTKAQMHVLECLDGTGQKIEFTRPESQEAACQLDAIGLCSVWTDAGNSLGVVFARITHAGRSALEAERQTP